MNDYRRTKALPSGEGASVGGGRGEQTNAMFYDSFRRETTV